MALLRRRNLGSRSTRIAFDTLHTVSLVGPALREGLTGGGAQRAVKQLRTLLGVSAVALTSDGQGVGFDGGSHPHGAAPRTDVAEALRTGKTIVSRSRGYSCGSAD